MKTEVNRLRHMDVAAAVWRRRAAKSHAFLPASRDGSWQGLPDA
jgi:hypothetical protein